MCRFAPAKELHSPEFYGKLISELNNIGWDRISFISEDLTRLSLQLTDAAGRVHEVHVSFPLDYPNSPPKTHCDLPKQANLSWDPNKSSLAHVVDQYERALSQFQDLWGVLDDFDQHTWVLEPDAKASTRSYSVTMRRIALQRHCSLSVEIDPMQPFRRCDVRFLGADGTVAPLRQALLRNLHEWDESKLPRVNLERVLDTAFPSPQTSEKEDFDMECAICYSYKIGDIVPDVICENGKCGRPFHRSCLFEWLKALPTSRTSFNTVFGSCPYCSEPLAVAEPEK